MLPGEIPSQRTGAELYETTRVIKRVGELALEMKSNGEDSDLRQELDDEYGPGGWAYREAAPITTEERLFQNMGLLIFEIYIPDKTE